MNALTLLFERKIERLRRLAYMYVGYESDSEEVSEKLYGVYIVILLAGAGLFMLAWVVVNVGKFLALFDIPLQPLYQLVFVGLALWLVLLVFRAVNTYDLQQFELSDLDLLCQVPLSTGLINLVWWVKSLFKRTIGAFILICAIISSTATYLSHGNDILALVVGGLAAALFIVVCSGLRWTLGLLRYLPRGHLNPIFGYGLAAALLVLAFTPYAQFIFWPASLAGWLLVGRATDENLTLTSAALAGMLVMTGLGVLAIHRLGRASRLAPAMEEGSLGGRFRLAAKVDRASASEAALLFHLGRRLQSGRSTFRRRKTGSDFWTGPARTVVFRQLLRLGRLPVTKLLPGGALAVGIGVVSALGLAILTYLDAPFILQIQVIFFASWVLMRCGITPLRRELAHPDILVNWPVSRLQMTIYYLVIGFFVPLVSGEAALGLAFFTGLDKGLLSNWLLVWPVLVAVSYIIALAFFKHGLGRWSGNPLEVPNAGPLAVILCGAVWSLSTLTGFSTGLTIAGTVAVAGILYLRQSEA